MPLSAQACLFDSDTAPPLTVVRPRPVGHGEWPPDYAGIYRWRAEEAARLYTNRARLAAARAYYASHYTEFICDWMDTYDPRRAEGKWVPFVLFHRQAELLTCVEDCERDQENLLVEKCRDGGVTWLLCAYSVCRWLFKRDDAVGWGSRKAELVDRLGEPDSIFEKMRLLLRRLPPFWLPEGFSWKVHSSLGKLQNPQNNSILSGEGGDNIGRGGRKAVFVVDESAHLERPEKVQSALGDNTNVQIHISSVNGLGNVFHRMRQGGVEWSVDNRLELPRGRTRVFVFDWRHHPGKTQEWYDLRKARAEREGLQAIFAQEVDRDYSAAVSNTAIPREWVMSAIDAHLRWPDYVADGGWMAGLDVADGGIDRNGLVVRHGRVIRACEEWGERDVGVTTRRAVLTVQKGTVQYDCVGVGAAVKSEYNRLLETPNPPQARFVAWNAGGKIANPFGHIDPDDPETPINRAMFANFKAQAWWSVRQMFYKTWRNHTQGVVYTPDEMVSLDSSMPLLHQLIDELAQPTLGQSQDLKMLINKKPDGMKSPNLGDAAVMCLFPAPEDDSHAVMGVYNG